MSYRFKVRITADNQEESDRVRAWLERRLPELKLSRGRVGGNPKYADDPKVLAYGELEVQRLPQLASEQKKPARRQSSASTRVERLPLASDKKRYP